MGRWFGVAVAVTAALCPASVGLLRSASGGPGTGRSAELPQFQASLLCPHIRRAPWSWPTEHSSPLEGGAPAAAATLRFSEGAPVQGSSTPIPWLRAHTPPLLPRPLGPASRRPVAGSAPCSSGPGGSRRSLASPRWPRAPHTAALPSGPRGDGQAGSLSLSLKRSPRPAIPEGHLELTASPAVPQSRPWPARGVPPTAASQSACHRGPVPSPRLRSLKRRSTS